MHGLTLANRAETSRTTGDVDRLQLNQYLLLMPLMPFWENQADQILSNRSRKVMMLKELIRSVAKGWICF